MPVCRSPAFFCTEECRGGRLAFAFRQQRSRLRQAVKPVWGPCYWHYISLKKSSIAILRERLFLERISYERMTLATLAGERSSLSFTASLARPPFKRVHHQFYIPGHPVFFLPRPRLSYAILFAPEAYYHAIVFARRFLTGRFKVMHTYIFRMFIIVIYRQYDSVAGLLQSRQRADGWKACPQCVSAMVNGSD